MQGESCLTCGGDGRISNSFGGGAKTCPSCHGTGRRSVDTGFHDVTKTKPSHYRATNAASTPQKATAPTTAIGSQLADEVQKSGVSAETKAKLVRDIMEHEGTHGSVTQTFAKKLRKQIRGG